MFLCNVNKGWQRANANSIDALIPEVWAAESLRALYQNTVALPLVHRDFSEEVKQQGETVHTRRPGKFEAKRKTKDDEITLQDASATDVEVKLDQHLHTSFIIKDEELSKSMKDLVSMYAVPALESIAQAIDQIILYQYPRFLTNNVGKLGTALDKSTIIAARTLMNQNLCPQSGRNFIVTPTAEGDILNIGDLTTDDKIADGAIALKEGSLGRRFGYSIIMSQNAPEVATGNTIVTGAINNSGGHAAGVSSITVDGLSAAIADGTWFTVAGDMIPHRVTGTTGGSTPTAIAFTPALKYAVANDAVVTLYTPGQVNQSVSPTGYAANYNKPLVVDTFSVAPKRGQFISFGTATDVYGAIGTPTTTSLLLDRSLAASVADDAKIGIGPAGNYNFAFHRNAIAFVSRPLVLPDASGGARSAVVNYNGMSLRVTMFYDGYKQGWVVTVDVLCGVQVLDTNLGCVIFS